MLSCAGDISIYYSSLTHSPVIIYRYTSLLKETHGKATIVTTKAIHSSMLYRPMKTVIQLILIPDARHLRAPAQSVHVNSSAEHLYVT